MYIVRFKYCCFDIKDISRRTILSNFMNHYGYIMDPDYITNVNQIHSYRCQESNTIETLHNIFNECKYYLIYCNESRELDKGIDKIQIMNIAVYFNIKHKNGLTCQCGCLQIRKYLCNIIRSKNNCYNEITNKL